MGVSSRYWEDLARHEGGSAIEEIWLNHPLVRKEVNLRVSGDSSIWPTPWLRSQIQQLPLGLSIGCGTGAFERGIVAFDVVSRVIGIDRAWLPLQQAHRLAGEAKMSDRISYVQADAVEFLRNHRDRFDAIFFHASLHHFGDPRTLLQVVRSALRPGGYLFFDEYVGPARNEWSVFRLLIPNVAYYLLPRRVRRPGLVRAPINREDPTEAIASSRIVPALHATFEHVTTRPYGGNLLSIVYPNLHRPPANGVSSQLFDEAITRLIHFERVLMRFGFAPYFLVALAQR